MAEHRINEEQAVKAKMWQAKSYQFLAREAAKGLTKKANKLPESEDKPFLLEQAEELEAQLKLPQDQQTIYWQLHRKPMPQKSTAVKKNISSLRERLREELHKKMPFENIESLILTKPKDGYDWNRKLYPNCRIVYRETDTRCLDFMEG